MNRVRLVLFGLMTLLCSAVSAGNGYYYPHSYCAPNYCPPSYSQSYHYTSTTYSAWTYRIYPGTEYYYRVRNRVENGCYYPEQDIWLYTYSNGCYYQHCKIADYLAKPALVLQPAAQLQALGQTVYGADPTAYAVAKLYGPKYASILQQQGSPSPVDVAGLLPPVATQSFAIQEAVSKQAGSASELMAQVLSAEQAKERANIEARRQLALQANQFQAFERMLGQFKDLSAVASQQAQVSATAFIEQIPVQDRTLAQIISTSCFQCHGAAKIEAGLDFKQAASFGANEWKKIRNAVISGRMPKGGTPLDDNQEQFFEDQYDRARSNKAPPAF